ncbi:MAG: dienelactone hydrolase family protein [Anaerolineales bacterium]
MPDMTPLGTVSSYLVRPSGSGPWPAIIVIQEWWCLDDQTMSIADRYGNEGYLAVAPDLYHGERAELGDNARAMELVQKYGHGALGDLERVYDALKAHPDCNGKIGAVGFCFGGRMALALGLSRPLAAVNSFYGGGMQQLFDRMPQMRAPVLALFGDQDVSIPAGAIAQLDELLDKAGVEHEVKTYPDSGHAFFRDSDPSVYRPAAAADAWEKSKQFFGRYLKN